MTSRTQNDTNGDLANRKSDVRFKQWMLLICGRYGNHQRQQAWINCSSCHIKRIPMDSRLPEGNCFCPVFHCWLSPYQRGGKSWLHPHSLWLFDSKKCVVFRCHAKPRRAGTSFLGWYPSGLTLFLVKWSSPYFLASNNSMEILFVLGWSVTLSHWVCNWMPQAERSDQNLSNQNLAKIPSNMALYSVYFYANLRSHCHV